MKTLLSLLFISLLFTACNRTGDIQETLPEHPKKAGITEPNIDIVTSDSDGYITTLSATHPVLDAVSTNDTLFLAEGPEGIEIINLSYHDKVSATQQLTLSDINAQELSLSKDKNLLFVKDLSGTVFVVDISVPNHPTIIKESTKEDTKDKQRTKNISYTYITENEESIETIDISTPKSGQQTVSFTQTKVFDIILSKQRNKTDNITGITLNDREDSLFVVTDEKYIQLYNFETLMEKVTKHPS